MASNKYALFILSLRTKDHLLPVISSFIRNENVNEENRYKAEWTLRTSYLSGIWSVINQTAFSAVYTFANPNIKISYYKQYSVGIHCWLQ